MIKSSYRLAALLIAATLAGCSLIPDYQRPALPVSNHWQSPPGDTSVNSYTWQQFYQQPALQKVISLALDHNRDLQIAALRVQEARAQFRLSRADLMPTIAAGASETSQHMPGDLYSTRATGPATYHQYQASLGVTAWELDFFGRIRSLNQSALESYLASAASAQATRISLISDAATGYLNLATDRDRLSLARDTAASQNNAWRLIRYRYDTGTADAQALAQAETSVRTAEADVEKYTRQVKQDVNALTLLTGTTLPASVIDSATLNTQLAFPALRAGMPSDLLTRRPDIIAAEHKLKSANANIGAARAAFFPSISLTANGGTMSDSLGHLFGGGTAAWSFVPSINLPVFTGGRNMANLDIAHLEKQVEIAGYEQSIQQAFKEVADALAGQETLTREYHVRIRSHAATQRYYQLAQARYQAGIDDYLKVLDAQREYYQSGQALLSARFARLNQNVVMYKVLGGGWS